ncbi:MAG: helix-turn-helix domain-containing protein [Chloroflexi bacterium]|nr:helix-turn-helix domain-containing protein [Chloroflexota bacterium]
MAYTVTEAARYAGTSPATVRRWIEGYENRDRHMEPVFAEKARAVDEPLRLSFLDLAEIVVVATFTRHGGRLNKMRQARRHVLSEHPDLDYPFANLRLKQLGGEVLHIIDNEMGGKAIAISLGGAEGEQHSLPGYAEDALDLFDADPFGLAERWYPYGRDIDVVLDPRFGGGRLTIAGTAIRSETITTRFFEYGETLDYIANDLGVERATTEALVRLARPV